MQLLGGEPGAEFIGADQGGPRIHHRRYVFSDSPRAAARAFNARRASSGTFLICNGELMHT